MDIMKAIAKRKSVRAFQPEQISEEALNQILVAGCAAPVGMKDYDSMHLTVIQDQEIIKKISDLAKQFMKTDREIFYGAPTLVIVSAKEEQPAPGLDYTNAGGIMENMMLAATELEVGSVILWSGGVVINEDKSLKEAVCIPEGFKPLASVGLGYAVNPDSTEKEMKMTISMNRI